MMLIIGIRRRIEALQYAPALMQIDALLALKMLGDRTILLKHTYLRVASITALEASKSKVSLSGAIPVFSSCVLTSVKCKGFPHFHQDRCKLTTSISPSSTSSVVRPPIRHSPYRGQGLCCCILILLYETFENTSLQDDPGALNPPK